MIIIQYNFTFFKSIKCHLTDKHFNQMSFNFHFFCVILRSFRCWKTNSNYSNWYFIWVYETTNNDRKTYSCRTVLNTWKELSFLGCYLFVLQFKSNQVALKWMNKVTKWSPGEMLFEKTFGTNHLRKCESLRFCGAVQIKWKKVDIENKILETACRCHGNIWLA